MTPPVWAAILLLGLGAAAYLLTRLPPRQASAAVVLAAAAGLAALRLFALAVPVAALGIGLWRSAGSAAVPGGGGQSAVESGGLRMTLDHDTGVMDGEVTGGPYQGRRLSELSPEALQELVDAFEAAGDEDSLSLLLAWLDRHRSKAAGSQPPPAGPGAMTEAEAYRILGLAPGASLEEVRAAYRRLMKRVHPDLGGSSALAAMLNAAKELLDPG